MKSATQEYLMKRIEELEEKILQLRISRRILMTLVESIEKEKILVVSQLTKENKQLKGINAKYAKKLMELRRTSAIHKDNLGGVN
ncbi:MAG: translation initiation factor 2 [Bacillota bacterium]